MINSLRPDIKMDKLLFVFIAICSFQYTHQFPRDWSNTAPYSQHTLMFSNFNPRYTYKPEDFMSAFGSDAISTNTFSADTQSLQNTETKSENEQFEDTPNTPDLKKNDSPKEEDEEHSWPFKNQPNSKSGGVYSSFFPIMIQGGSSKGLGRDASEYTPGSSTAIANSFSTGRGGVASSHATSLGDPYLSMLFRNAVFKKAMEKSE
nr:uncharacterized protein LOC111425590 [Onthophagus taurus]